MFISRKEYQSLVDANMYLLDRKNNYMDEAYEYEAQSIKLEQTLMKTESKLREIEKENVKLQLELIDKTTELRQFDKSTKDLINKTVNLMEKYNEVVNENTNLRAETMRRKRINFDIPPQEPERW